MLHPRLHILDCLPVPPRRHSELAADDAKILDDLEKFLTLLSALPRLLLSCDISGTATTGRLPL
jgi:hypothetical protein